MTSGRGARVTRLRVLGNGWCIGDRGSGTVFAVAIVALVAALALFATALGGAMVARHRAGSAADLAALAAADSVARAEADPCIAAARVATLHGASLTACSVHGSVVDVVVEMAPGGLVGTGRMAVVRARAGPA